MRSLYALPEAARVALCLFAVACVIAAALAFVLGCLRFRCGLPYWLEGLLSLLVLCQALLCTALVAQVQHNVAGGFVVHGGHEALRRALFAAVALASAGLFAKGRPLPAALALAATPPALPAVEAWLGRAFPAAFAAALAALFAGSVWLALSRYGELQTSLSGLSVKQAMDSLGTAVLFYREDGRILLQNHKMQELMLQTAGRIFFNGRLYVETVSAQGDEHAGALRLPDGSFVYRLPDSAWLFTARQVPLGRGRVTQLTATDVTEQDRGARLLQQKQQALRRQEEQLRALIDKLEEICLSEELLRVKAETHDLMGQKLTLLLRHLRQGQWPEEAFLSSLSADLNRHRQQASQGPGDPAAELGELIKSYAYTGVRVWVHGDLPPEPGQALALVAILREATANAVIHGYADRIYARILQEGHALVLRVTDNSDLPPKAVCEGGGIAGMRRRLERFGGELTVRIAPRFTIVATIPRGGGERGVRADQGAGRGRPREPAKFI
ncbi:MAG: hypothetical protein GXX99_03385 [Clostridiales bacterium]|nr:hypothetical protein [Clostridiales bacterium]